MQQTSPCYSRRWRVAIEEVLHSKKITVVFELKECWISKKKEKSLDRQKYYYIVLLCTAVVLNTVNIELLEHK